jgi:hypothetical protein
MFTRLSVVAILIGFGLFSGLTFGGPLPSVHTTVETNNPLVLVKKKKKRLKFYSDQNQCECVRWERQCIKDKNLQSAGYTCAYYDNVCTKRRCY